METILQSARILDLFRALHADGGSDGTGDVVLLSARPHTYKDLSEQQTYEHFAKLRHANLLHATPTLLAGDLASSMQIVTKAAAPANAYEAVGAKKAHNLTELALLYPDFELVFFGDNGQGDVRTAERVLGQLRAQVRLALINVVQPIDATCGWPAGVAAHSERGAAAMRAWAQLGIRFYRTAAGAACHLHDEGMLSDASLRAVCAATAAQLEGLRPKLAASGQLSHCLAEFVEELERANKLLGPELALPMPAPAIAVPEAATAPADVFGAASASKAASRLPPGLARIAGGMRLRASSAPPKPLARHGEPTVADRGSSARSCTEMD